MILYQLRCEDDHTFEAWFRDSVAYDKQASHGHVECPYCGSTKVAKAIMAPHIVSGASGATGATGATGEPQADANLSDTRLPDPRSPDNRSSVEVAERAQNVAQQILDAVGQIRDYAEENFENVGEGFADEARKIHDGEGEERGIYGRATEDEARELEEDGVEFVRLPGAPRRNG